MNFVQVRTFAPPGLFKILVSYVRPVALLSSWDCSAAKALLQAESATASRRKVPTMTSLSDLSILIVDPNGEAAFVLRQSFIAAGAKTHVVENLAAAERFLGVKSIDAVVLPYSQDPQTVNFCRLLASQNIPSVFTSEPPARYPTRRPLSGAIIAVKGLIAEAGLETYHSVN